MINLSGETRGSSSSPLRTTAGLWVRSFGKELEILPHLQSLLSASADLAFEIHSDKISGADGRYTSAQTFLNEGWLNSFTTKNCSNKSDGHCNVWTEFQKDMYEFEDWNMFIQRKPIRKDDEAVGRAYLIGRYANKGPAYIFP